MGPTSEEIERVKEQFTVVDQDGSGLIEKQELEVLLSILGMDPQEEHLDSLFEVLDTDKDGFISFEEFVDFVFSTGDKDFLTEADLEKVRQLSKRKLKQGVKEEGEESKSTESFPSQICKSEAKLSSDPTQEAESLRNRVEELEKQLQQRDKVVKDLTAELKKAQKDLEETVQRSQHGSKEDADALECQGLKEEIVQLKNQLHEKHFLLQRLENQQEKTVEGYAAFVKALMKSSASERLDKHCDLSTVEMLGKGSYGFVMTCRDKENQEHIVVKLQGPRWASVAAQEWAHGIACKHENIVSQLEVLMHHDRDALLEGKITKAFDDGVFSGKRPKIFPDRYICMMMEHMNRGTVQHLADKGLINLEGLASVVRQVASGLAYMHKSKRTHNDVKPENILLKQVTESPCLVVKLADLGLAQCSVERERDMELTAYTFWCLGLGETFEHVPPAPDRPFAVEQFKQYALQQDHRSDLRMAMGEVIQDLWSLSTSMATVAATEEFKSAELVVEAEKHEEIATNAKRELSARMERTALLWKAVHLVTAAKKWSEEIDYQGWH